MPAIPDRWMPYSTHGKVIEGTRIICFKVPLRKIVQESEFKVGNIQQIWDVDAVLQEIPNLGLVIDLTNTAKYYDPEEFKKRDVMHRKLLVPGREIPPARTLQIFFDAVDEFLDSCTDKLIGVHCTHGLNRTGYMVCKYMVSRMGLNPDVAIARFETARGYRIERQNYLADIRGSKVIPKADFGQSTRVERVLTLSQENKSTIANKRAKNRKHSGSDDEHGTFKFDFRYDY